MVDQLTRVASLRSRLLLDMTDGKAKFVWYGSLSLRLIVIDGSDVTQTFATDGTHLAVNTAYAETLTDLEIMGVIAHETMHCAFGHPWRLESRDHAEFNIAADYAINPIILDSGLSLPTGALINPDYAGKSAEQIYDLRHGKPDAGKPDPGTGNDNPGTGDVLSPPSNDPGTPGDETGNTPQTMNENDWSIAGEQAAMIARKAGNMPGSLDVVLKSSRESITDWREILREYVAAIFPSDYSWSNPNRRYVSSGLYLPGVIRDGSPYLGIAVDSSGSVSDDMLQSFGVEIRAIIAECHPEYTEVIYCDTRVHNSQTFGPDDEITLHAYGRGGTAFQPALDHFSALDTPPACVIYLTDLDAGMPREPEYPVLWIVPEHTRDTASFGQTIRIKI